MSTRTCACGCGRDIEGRHRGARYLNDRHRQDAYRKRVAQAIVAAGLPARLSLKTAEAHTSTHSRHTDANSGGSARRGRKPSDVRVGFPQLEAALGRDRAEALLTPAQRARLQEARRAA
jgi:hypothetical protein